MSARTGRSRGAPRRSPARTAAWLLAGAVLAGAGFAAGIVAGVLAQEPGLVADHLAGRGHEVPWTAGPEPGSGGKTPAPAVAAAPPAASAAAQPAVSAPSPKSAPPAAGDRGTGSFVVQVGAFAASEPAEQLAGSLRQKGYAVQVTPGAGSRDGRWRVRVGPVAGRDEADRLAARLKTREGLPTWVLEASGG